MPGPDPQVVAKARELIAACARGPRDWPAVSALRETLRPMREAGRKALTEAAVSGASPEEREVAALLLRDLFSPWPER